MSPCGLLFATLLAATACHGLVKIPLQQVVLQDAEEHEITAADGTTKEVIMSPKYLPVAQIQIGTPPQMYRVLIDTDSSDLCVGSTELCKSIPQYCNYHNVFRPDLSSTYRQDKQDGDIYLSYAEIEAQGPLAQDTLTVGGIAIPDVKFVPVTDFKLTYQMKAPADRILTAPVDGILGLSFQKGSQSPSLSAPNTNLIRQPVFSLYMKKDSQDGSTLIIGGSDPKLYLDKLKYVPIISNNTFMVAVHSFAVDGVQVPGADKYRAVIDTTSTAIYLPLPLYYQLQDKLAAKTQQQPSDDDDELPILNFNLGGHDFTLEKEFYMSKDQNGSNQILVFPTTENDFIVLGYVFMQKYYIEYNMEHMTIGLAPAM